MPCHQQVAEGQSRCDDCTTALAYHPDARVRQMLARDPDTPSWALSLLAEDVDAGVAAAALHRSGEQPTQVLASVPTDLESGW